LALENYISDVIKQPNSIKLANKILHYLDLVNKESTKITEREEIKNHLKLTELIEELKKKSLTPMEKRFIYEEIARLIRAMESLRHYWLQKSLTGVKYVGAVGAVVAATLFFRKKNTK